MIEMCAVLSKKELILLFHFPLFHLGILKLRSGLKLRSSFPPHCLFRLQFRDRFCVSRTTPNRFLQLPWALLVGRLCAQQVLLKKEKLQEVRVRVRRSWNGKPRPAESARFNHVFFHAREWTGCTHTDIEWEANILLRALMIEYEVLFMPCSILYCLGNWSGKILEKGDRSLLDVFSPTCLFIRLLKESNSQIRSYIANMMTRWGLALRVPLDQG